MEPATAPLARRPRWDPCVGSYLCPECGHRWAAWESRERHTDTCPNRSPTLAASALGARLPAE